MIHHAGRVHHLPAPTLSCCGSDASSVAKLEWCLSVKGRVVDILFLHTATHASIHLTYDHLLHIHFSSTTYIYPLLLTRTLNSLLMFQFHQSYTQHAHHALTLCNTCRKATLRQSLNDQAHVPSSYAILRLRAPYDRHVGHTLV